MVSYIWAFFIIIGAGFMIATGNICLLYTSPAKYPFDAERYALGYSVLKPDKTFQVAHDEKTLESLLNQGGIVVAVRTFDGFYDLNDITFAKNLIR